MSKTIIKAIAGLGIVAGLGVTALPLSSYALEQDVTVTFEVDPTLGGDEAICTAADGSGNAIAAGLTTSVDCIVGYSANGGASVSIVDKDGTGALTGVNNTSNTIAPFSTTANQESLVPGTEGWGYKFTASTAGATSGGLIAIADAAEYNGVPTDTALTVGTNISSVTNAQGTFTFGLQTAITTPADTYSNVVTIAITPAA